MCGTKRMMLPNPLLSHQRAVWIILLMLPNSRLSTNYVLCGPPRVCYPLSLCPHSTNIERIN